MGWDLKKYALEPKVITEIKGPPCGRCFYFWPQHHVVASTEAGHMVDAGVVCCHVTTMQKNFNCFVDRAKERKRRAAAKTAKKKAVAKAARAEASRKKAQEEFDEKNK